MAHVLVVGGGIVGLSCALALLSRGEQVTLIDNDADGQAASWGNAGHLAIEQVEPLASPAAIRALPGRLFLRGGPASFPASAMPEWLPFGLKLIKAARTDRFHKGCITLGSLLDLAMPAWDRLAGAIGGMDLLQKQGHLVAWHDPRAAAKGKAAWQAARTGSASVEDASETDLARIAALCNRAPAGALRFSGSGQIADLPRLRASLLAAFHANGGRLEPGTANLRLANRRVDVPGCTADTVLVCAGARSAALLASAGHRIPLIAERGYHMRCDPSGWPKDMPPLVFEERSLIVTRFESALQLSSFVEFNRIDAPADPAKWRRLENHAAELGLPVRGPLQHWMGRRPTLPDYIPAIGRSRNAENLYYAFGHQHLGLTLGPVTGELIAQLMTARQCAFPLAPFDISRFG